MSANDDLTLEQMQQLSAVFRSEAIEHIKAMAEVLFAVEDGNLENKSEVINRAFREAHSLKGSAATLGFNKVSVMAHRFEDALGKQKQQDCDLSSKELETLLNALETIRHSIMGSEPGEDEFNSRELAVMEQLAKVFSLEDKKEVSAEKESVRQSKFLKDDKEKQNVKPENRVQPDTSEKINAPEGLKGRGTTDELVRVSQVRIDEVISEFGELFEASLQIESLGHDLRSNTKEASRLSESMSDLLGHLEGSLYEAEAMEILDMARNLMILSQNANAKFEGNHRDFVKHVQRCQDSLRALRIAPMSNLHFTIRNQVRETAVKIGKKVELQLRGGEYAIDRAILDAIEKPLIHLIRNSIDHGIESPEQRRAAGKPVGGKLLVQGRHLGDAVELSISDDGKGINPEHIQDALIRNYGFDKEKASKLSVSQLFDYLFEPGFSTSAKVSQISGRGVGLDVVKYTVEHLGGEVSIESEFGVGTRIALRLPLTMSSVKCLLFEAAMQTMAIPASNISRVVVVKEGDIITLGGGKIIVIDGEQVPLTTFEEVLGLSKESSSRESLVMHFAAIVRFADRRYAFGFDQIFEYTQLVIKPLGDLLERVPNISGLALLGTGNLCLVLNPSDLVRTASGSMGIKVETKIASKNKAQKTVLVVDDSIAIRTMQQALLESSGFKVLTASDGLKALQVLGNNVVDVVLSDVQMPNMDGFELAKAIKSRTKTREIPVVLITSLGSKEDIAAGMQAGADAHIVKKELTRSELLKTIGQLI